MTTSLSLILPVHNAELTLERDVFLLVEFLPELTPAFEILIIDDGSVDDTIILACDLATRFPQIRDKGQSLAVWHAHGLAGWHQTHDG